MELIRLDSTTFQPDELIEGHTSLIWNKKHIEAGRFELETPYVQDTLDKLPNFSLVSLRDDDEVMLVMNYEINQNKDQKDVLKLSGYTIDYFLKFRPYIAAPLGKKVKTNQTYNDRNFPLALIWDGLVNTHPDDVICGGDNGSYAIAIPNLYITDDTYTTGSSAQRWIWNGDRYDRIKKLVRKGGYGLRNVRDRNTINGTVIGVGSNGAITRTATYDIQGCKMELFEGIDRTLGNGSNPEAVFSYKTEDLKSSKYFWSEQNHIGSAWVLAHINNVGDVANPTTDLTDNLWQSTSKWDARTLYVDYGETDQNDLTALLAGMEEQGLAALKDGHREIIGFDAEINPSTNVKYGVDYGLGDKVTVIGRYGFQKNMYVSEFTRVLDANGERSYPGLTLKR